MVQRGRGVRAPQEQLPGGERMGGVRHKALPDGPTGQPDAMKAHWDNIGLRTFIDICVEEVNANNRGKEGTLTPLGYDNVTLTQKTTCIGFDPITKTIAASDEWWANEIQRNELAAKFRFAPLEDEIKLSTIFDDVSVTNEYAMAAPH
ncbi:hypothetical protein D1007_03291 [Hordeum vulgare]|nr:hypothetical protein D1007_03291 [Hordeum vulgare]